MSHENAGPQPDPRSQRYLICASCIAILAANITCAPFSTLVALKMGATPFYIGALNAIHLGTFVLQLVTMGQVQRRGKKFVLILWNTLTLIAMVPLLFLPEIWKHYREWALPSFMILVSIRHVTRTMSLTAWMPLLHDNTTAENRGSFFGRMRTYWKLILLIWLVSLALLAKDEAPWWLIRSAMAIGLLSQGIYILCLLPAKERSHLGRSESMPKMISRPLRDHRFRWMLLYILCYGTALGLADPFRVVYLKSLGYPDSVLLLGPATLFLGGILTQFAWGKLADRIGNRGIFSISHVGMMVAIAAWLLVDNTTSGLVLTLIVLATIGIFNGGNSIVQTRYMFSIVQQDHQAAYITVATVLGMVSIGLAGLAGGALLTWFGDFEIHQGALHLNAYHLLFICSALLFTLPHAIRTRLRQGKEVPSAKMIAFITRPLRTMLGSMATLVPPLDDIESHDSRDTTDQRPEPPVQS